MRSTRTAITAGILLMTLGVLGVPGGRGAPAALAQAGMPSTGMSGGGMMGSMGMMGGPFSPSARPLTMDRAVQILRAWPAANNLDGLVLDEVEAYTQNFYGQFKERDTGRSAIQVLVDRYTGRAMPEMGPNMMWNTKYGQAMMQVMMGGMGMMGGPEMIGSGGMMGNAPAPQQGTAPLGRPSLGGAGAGECQPVPRRLPSRRNGREQGRLLRLLPLRCDAGRPPGGHAQRQRGDRAGMVSHVARGVPREARVPSAIAG